MEETKLHQLKRTVGFSLLVVMGAMWGLQFAMLKLAAQGGYPPTALEPLTIALTTFSDDITRALAGITTEAAACHGRTKS